MPRIPVALVIGAARDIGRAVSLVLAAEGPGRPAHAIVVADEDERAGLATVRQLEAEGATARFVTCDVTREDDVAAAVHTATETFGRLDVLVNSAGIEGPALPVHAQPPDAWRRVFDVNVNGTFYALRHALPHMLKAERGLVVNVAGAGGAVMYAATAASQHAVIGLTRTAALECAQSGVRVNAVCLGTADPAEIRESPSARASAEWGDRVPGLDGAAAVAGAVAYLCSDAAASVTGQAIEVGGRLGEA